MTTDTSLRFLCLTLLLSSTSLTARGDTPGDAVPWRPMKLIQASMGAATFTWNGDALCLSNQQHQIRFYPGRRKAEVNGTVVWLNAPADGAGTDGSGRLASIDLDLLQLSMLPQNEGAAKSLRVLLDPGHGGDDEGASSKSPEAKEKDLTLALAKRIGAQLKKAGLHVDYTRTRDTTLSLDERSQIARKKRADLFISIHANHASNPNACGVETYVLPPSGFPGTAEGSRARGWQIGNRNDFHNTLLGFSIHRNLAATPDRFDRGLKRQSFSVLRETSCPAVLLEFGFLSNQAETRRMLCADWQEQSTAAVVAGVLSYAKKVEALDQAVADKRKRDTEANERWRRHLAEQALAKKGALPLQVEASPSAAPVVHVADTADSERKADVTPPVTLAQVTPARLPCAVLSEEPPATRDYRSTVATVATTTRTGTNAAPVRLDALIEFYAPNEVQ